MNIYVDESGSFVNSPNLESWNVVAAVAVAEPARATISEALKGVRTESAAMPKQEMKLNHIDEATYRRFLAKLDRKDFLLFATATDAGLNSLDRVAHHQAIQVAKIRENIPRMRYEGGRLGVQTVASELEALSPQLYVQLTCQVRLIDDVLRRSINYFAQRRPKTLTELRWRIDQKNVAKPTFERAFEKIAPALLQSRSIRQPFESVYGFNYSHMKAYEFEDGKAPDYLHTEYGLPAMEGFNIGKMIRDNIKFVDSKRSEGVQVADLLASGLRRLLRGQFKDNRSVAQAIGRLTLQNQRGSHPILLVTLAEVEQIASGHVERLVRLITKNSKSMLLPNAANGA